VRASTASAPTSATCAAKTLLAQGFHGRHSSPTSASRTRSKLLLDRIDLWVSSHAERRVLRLARSNGWAGSIVPVLTLIARPLLYLGVPSTPWPDALISAHAMPRCTAMNNDGTSRRRSNSKYELVGIPAASGHRRRTIDEPSEDARSDGVRMFP
jgi:hypothetical protein